MKFHIHLAAALCCTVAVTASSVARAQSQSQRSMVHNGATPAPEELPAGQMRAGQMSGGQMGPDGQAYYPGGPGSMDFSPNGYYPDGCADGNCDGNFCGDGCCDAPSCGSDCCGDGWGNCCGFRGGQFYFTADYLNVRASFSEATAKVVENLAAGTDDFVPLDFGFNSSYRFGGGYRLCCCGEEIRFLYTRMTSDAFDTAENGDIVPIEASPPPGGITDISSGVSANTYDVEWAKTIPLGGCCCDSCSSPCGNGCQDGCCNTCGSRCCPAWDITWSGGFRWGDVKWGRSFVAQDSTDVTVTDGESAMTFRGGGLRTGLEGRRYFGKDGWLSLYAKGDLSLLFGRVNVVTQRSTFDPSAPTVPTTSNTQTFHNQQIIPVTEIEAGVTGQVTCHAALTAGYLMAAWHDLGFRDQDQLNTLLPISYDDANILGFNGFFARLEYAF
ncbi:MAG TPA: Lpg1974 family pore-forming outer membrane protein [Lacipirellulaceae bacterium]|nr:Lpg1974 family pore-forming outer membrane protein [Lacipirellulaceae bacterium]